MIDGLGNINGVGPVGATGAARGAGGAAAAAPAAFQPLPATPPSEVLASLDRAQAVLRQLDRSGVSLRIEYVDTGHGKRLHVEVRDRDGNMLREIPPTGLAKLLSGGSTGLAVDAVG